MNFVMVDFPKCVNFVSSFQKEMEELLLEDVYFEMFEEWTFVKPDASTEGEGTISFLDSLKMSPSPPKFSLMGAIKAIRLTSAIAKAKANKEFTQPIRV